MLIINSYAIRSVIQGLTGPKRHGHDSAVLTDFQIGLDLANNKISLVEAGIAKLKAMPDDDGRADRRQAQLLLKQYRYAPALELLTRLLNNSNGSHFLIRTLRAKAAAWSGDLDIAQQDINVIKRMPGRESVALRLQVELFAAQKLIPEAEELFSKIQDKTPQDSMLEAVICDQKAGDPNIGFSESTRLRQHAEELKNRFSRRNNKYEE